MADFSDVLFVSDFDHTMTGTDGTIPLANRRAIEMCIRDSRYTTPASSCIISLIILPDGKRNVKKFFSLPCGFSPAPLRRRQYASAARCRNL